MLGVGKAFAITFISHFSICLALYDGHYARGMLRRVIHDESLHSKRMVWSPNYKSPLKQIKISSMMQ